MFEFYSGGNDYESRCIGCEDEITGYESDEITGYESDETGRKGIT